MGFPALHAGLFIFDPFGVGAKAPNTSIFDASRLKALNMNSPRQSLGRSIQPATSLEGLNPKVKSIFDEVAKNRAFRQNGSSTYFLEKSNKHPGI
jgi:hypothetical protein